MWDISVSKLSFPLIGTASADKTARIWGIDSGKCLAVYTGHAGSVNSISFHPTQDLVMTASGDGTAHVWQAAILPESLGSMIPPICFFDLLTHRFLKHSFFYSVLCIKRRISRIKRGRCPKW